MMTNVATQLTETFRQQRLPDDPNVTSTTTTVGPQIAHHQIVRFHYNFLAQKYLIL